jgi:hypothetical protein
VTTTVSTSGTGSNRWPHDLKLVQSNSRRAHSADTHIATGQGGAGVNSLTRPGSKRTSHLVGGSLSRRNSSAYRSAHHHDQLAAWAPQPRTRGIVRPDLPPSTMAGLPCNGSPNPSLRPKWDGPRPLGQGRALLKAHALDPGTLNETAERTRDGRQDRLHCLRQGR